MSKTNPFDLSGKVALVTGGNAGLGLGYARGLARAGADVVIWGRRSDRNTAAAEELRQFGGRVSAPVVDAGSESEIIAGMQAVVDEYGRIDCVVANAGMCTIAPVTEMSSDTWHGLLNVNLHGAFFTLREGAKHMAARAKAGELGGSLIACGSLTIFAGAPGLAHYAAAKAALLAVTRTMAVELGPQQIRANVIAPGLIASEMTQADPEAFKFMAAKTAAKAPLGRAGHPDDLEGAVVYLASDASRFHTGDVLTIDGGERASLM